MICERCKTNCEDDAPFCTRCGLRFKKKDENDAEATILVNPDEAILLDTNNSDTILINTDGESGAYDNMFVSDEEQSVSGEKNSSEYKNRVVKHSDSDDEIQKVHNEEHIRQFDRKIYIILAAAIVFFIAAAAIFVFSVFF